MGALDTLAYPGGVWAVDFEYSRAAVLVPGVLDPVPTGDRPHPVAMCARELRSGRQIVLFEDELAALRRPPFPTDETALIVSYNWVAEGSCFAVLGWPQPKRIVDLYVEYCRRRNGREGGRGLLDALATFGIDAISRETKTDMQRLVLRDGPWTREEETAIREYVTEDVVVLGPLLAGMLPDLRVTTDRWGQALIRGRAMAGTALVEDEGIPIDRIELARLLDGWDQIRGSLIRRVDSYGLWEGETFKVERFRRWLAKRKIAWPMTKPGPESTRKPLPKTDEDTFHEMSRTHPEVAPIGYLLHDLRQLKSMNKLPVGKDGRNRTSLMPYRQISGRNRWYGSQYILAQSAWLRALIQPPEGYAIANLDYSAQEPTIAAVLSKDQDLIALLRHGDPYLTVSARAGLVPDDATKATHETERNRSKTSLLGIGYGMQDESLATRLATTAAGARRYRDVVERDFPTFLRWFDLAADEAGLFGIESVFGWPLLATTPIKKPNLRRNFLCQANGAEMTRLAMCHAVEAGVRVGGVLHDSLLIVAPVERIDDAVATTRAAMVEASQVVLKGFALRVDAKVIRHPDRYRDVRGTKDMWAMVQEELDELDR